LAGAISLAISAATLARSVAMSDRSDILSWKHHKIVAMPPFLYRCPNTGYRVQGLVADDVSEDPKSYEAVTCTACQQVHFVNPTSGKVLGAEEE
jgi:hypothetical protein